MSVSYGSSVAIDVDLDFQRYVERRKGALEAQAREGAAYAYGGDLRLKKTLDSIKPVRLAVESTGRLWRSVARKELLDTATKVSPQQLPRIDALADQAARTLHIPRPTVYVVPELGAHDAQAFGTDEDAYIVLSEPRVRTLTDAELLFVLGHACGHIQNNQVVLTTAHYYLVHAANRFLKWIVTPAVMALSAWSRRADITCDRAGLIASKNLEASLAVIEKLGAGPAAAPVGEPAAPEPARGNPRGEALRIFAESAYYKALVGGSGGLTQAEVDGKVGEVLSP